ncbi:hypothetical protein A3A99_00580 [Candidatus Nomurabacteria bacterium RIFCSPLOWO2_01_FULL_41_18]|nr:MAG: hypothetical protein A3A99_00580 [Candidatus Nomurabacteria bacterium RIFCSPLOWO2_01_FULL_41_18]
MATKTTTIKKTRKMSDVTMRPRKKKTPEVAEVEIVVEQEITTPAAATPPPQGGEEKLIKFETEVVNPETPLEPTFIKGDELPQTGQVEEIKKETAPSNKFINNIKSFSFSMPALPSMPSFKVKKFFTNKEEIEKIAPKDTKARPGNSFFTSLKSLNFTRLSIKDQTFFVKRLSFLIKAGIPMGESLVMIRTQTKKRGYASILDSVISNVMNGQRLSSSLARFKHIFGDFTINIIEFGEESGILSQNLEYIADELKKRQALRKKIISASIYPIIVTIATIGIVIFLMVFLFPKIMPIFTSLKYDLPLTTRMVIAISNFFSQWGLLTFGILFILGVAFIITLKKSPTVHFYFDKFLLKLPVIGKIIRDYNMANFTRTMGLLLRGGISMSEALPISAKTTPNLVYKKEFKALGAVVSRGAVISTHLNKNRHLFPDLVSQIVSVGEHSGNLSNSLIYLSEMYEAEIDDFTKNLSSMVEPVLMIIMGILVGFIAISIITPIYGITQHLNVK